MHVLLPYFKLHLIYAHLEQIRAMQIKQWPLIDFAENNHSHMSRTLIYFWYHKNCQYLFYTLNTNIFPL